MITVPSEYQTSLEILLKVPTGMELVLNERTANIKAMKNEELDAHGESIDKETIHLSRHRLSVPQMSCILAHEMTHCHDLHFFGGKKRNYKTLGLTEVSAHFNQGIILRELQANRKIYRSYKSDIDDAIRGNTVFGNSYTWRTRADVIEFLSIKPQYEKFIGNPLDTGVGLWHDDMWTSKYRFHCDENWDHYTKVPRSTNPNAVDFEQEEVEEIIIVANNT